MGVRMQGGAYGGGLTYPGGQRRDRSLDYTIGVHPESVREESDCFGAWGVEYWPGWQTGWMGCTGNIFVGDAYAGFDLQPYYIRPAWTHDLKWGGSKQTPYTIKGYILDQNGSPAPGVTVQLIQVSVPFEFIGGIANDIAINVAITTSDANGFYAFWVKDNTTKYKVRAHSNTGGGSSAENLVGS